MGVMAAVSCKVRQRGAKTAVPPYFMPVSLGLALVGQPPVVVVRLGMPPLWPLQGTAVALLPPFGVVVSGFLGKRLHELVWLHPPAKGAHRKVVGESVGGVPVPVPLLLRTELGRPSNSL